MLVDFAIIGAMKSGTTSLAYQLAQHPEIAFCRKKEPHFFSTAEDWEKELTEYHALFDPSPGQVCGEGSPTYTCLPVYPHTAKRMHSYNPNFKLIYIMRQPVMRIESHYAHKLVHSRTQHPPEIEVFANPTYLDRSRYAMQLEPYLELFPRDNILLLLFEEYVAALRSTLEMVGRFLGVSSDGFNGIDLSARNRSMDRLRSRRVPRVVRRVSRFLPGRFTQQLQSYFFHGSSAKPAFDADLRMRLWHSLEGDICKLECIMGQSLDIWRA